MINRKLLVMFDCDGTLSDSLAQIVQYMQQAWRFTPVPCADAIGAIIGLKLQDAIAKLDENLSQTQIETISAEYIKQARAENTNMPPLFPGMREVIEALHAQGHQIGIATGMGRIGLQKILKHYKLLEILSPLKTADDGLGKPNPDILLQAMAETATSPENTIMIGDSIYDMQMADAANVQALGVTWGYGSKKNLLDNKAQKVVDKCPEIIDFCQQIAHRQ